MKAGMVMTSGNERVHWMNLMKAGMVMIVIRNGCRRGQNSGVKPQQTQRGMCSQVEPSQGINK